MTGLFVLRRELKALVRLPQTYAIAAAYLIISGIFFVNILISTERIDLGQYYSNIANTLLVLVPVVAMRSFAEERRSGSLDVTLTWPLSRTGLVAGKFAANTLFVWVLSSVVWLYFWLMADLGSIQGSRTAGGYVGLLLIASAFSALALMVSARAASPTAAAFLGFGLLLFLWILDYAPGWIGDSLRDLGPVKHYEAFHRGVIYWEDVAYFVILTLVGLGLAVAALNRERPGVMLRSLIRRGAAFGLALILWTGGTALADDLDAKIDLTETKQHTLTAVTRKVIRELPTSARLTAFIEPISPEVARLQDLVRQYRNAGAHISVRILDPDVQPAKAHQAGVKLYGQVLVEVGERREVIDSANQIALTSALHRLSGRSTSRACFTIGHGERSITDKTRHGASSLAGELRRLYYEVKPLALSALGAEPELTRCTVVVVVGPRVPFLDTEAELLSDYTRNNGRLVVMADMDSPRDHLNGLLAPWGVSFGNGIVSDLSALAGDPGSIVTDYYPSKTPVTFRLAEEELPVVLTSAVPIEPTSVSDENEDEGGFIPLVRSSPKSWAELPSETAGGEGSRFAGPFVLAGMIDSSRVTGGKENPSIARTRIAVVGSVDVASNRVLEMLGNREFLSALVQWVAREDDLIAAGRAPSGLYKLVLTQGEKNRLIRQGIVLPAAAVLVLLPLPLLRLKRG